MDLDDTVCLCFRVTKRKLVNFLRRELPRVPSQLSECGGAGTGCGWCVPFLRKYFDESNSPEKPIDDSLTPQEYAQQRGDYIKAGKGVPAPGAIPPPE